MPDFYYQIKARQDTDCEYSRWIWPPVFSGMVTADNKKDARALVDEEYGQKFPMRVMEKDLKTANFLLALREVPDNDHRTRGLFSLRPCKKCGGGFRVIDHYNNHHQKYVGADFCSDDCKTEWTKEHDAALFTNTSASGHPPVIYRIENIKTGMSYVGQTSQPFTLRWWQHFFHGTNTKFHQAIANSQMTDWIFSVLEVIDMNSKPDDLRASDFIFNREQFWIDKLGTIAGGYNTATAKLLPEPTPLLELLNVQNRQTSV